MSEVSLPLNGKRILVTRDKSQSNSFSNLVLKNGGIPIEIPLIDFRPVPISKHLQLIINQWFTYDWVIFTSRMAVESFFNLVENFHVSKWPKIAVIGEKTERIIKSKGLSVHFVPTKFVTEVFTVEFSKIITPGMKVLIPKGNLARKFIYDSLQSKGVQVDELVVYETYFPKESEKRLSRLLKEKGADILSFTSPSTVDYFMKIVEQNALAEHISQCIIACIGPVTKKRIEFYGFKVHAVPEKYTVEDTVESIISYINKTEG